MIIEIGNKPLNQLSQEDLRQIVIIEGCCPALTVNGEPCWGEPIVTDFNNTMFSDTIFLDYNSYRIRDNLKSSDFVFFFDFKNFRFHYTRDYDQNKNQAPNGKNIKIETIRFLISKGYDVPIYNPSL